MIMIDYILKYILTFSVISNVISELFRYFRPIIIFIIVITIFRIVLKFIKYGFKIFPFSRNKNVYNYRQQIIANSINKIEGYRKIVPLTNYHSDLLIIDENGIYLINYYDQSGTLLGHITNSSLTLKKGENVFKEVSNPYIMILEDEIKLKSILNNQPIKKYIIFDNNCNIQVDGKVDVETVLFRNFYHILKSDLKKQNLRNVDVDKYYNQLTAQINDKTKRIVA